MMTHKSRIMKEQSLDPENWHQMRKLGHQVIDDVIDLLCNIGHVPVWNEVPHEVKNTLSTDLPQFPTTANDVYVEFLRTILPYPKGNIHPRFFAWVQGGGTPLGAFADLLASAMNPNVTIGEHSAMYVDQQVVKWCKQLMGFPETSSGLLVSGGSMANITALTVARNHKAGYDVRTNGLYGSPAALVLYCSVETHSCVLKAAEILGLGKNSVRLIGVDKQYRIKIKDLEKQIQTDLKTGFSPFCVVATVGTVNTGAIDPLKSIRDICRTYQLWFHIDGAYGAPAKLTGSHKQRLRYIEDADSVAFDLHKWFQAPYEAGCVLIKDQEVHRAAFSFTPKYLMNEMEGLAGGLDPITNYGFELSRGFKALKVWMSFKEHGIKKITRQIVQNLRQAKHLGLLITRNPELELMAPISLSIVCYRFIRQGISQSEANALNRELLIKLQVSGIASPSSTILGGAYCIRVCILNHRTKTSDIELLVAQSIKIGYSISEAIK